MTQSPPDGSGQRSDSTSRVEWSVLRRAIAMRGRASYRYLGRLWPLILLGAVSIAIILTSDAPAVYAVAVALGTLGVAIAVRVSDLSAVSRPSERIARRMRDPRIVFCVLGAVLHMVLLVRVLTEPTN